MATKIFRPISAGSYTELTPVGGTYNWQVAGDNNDNTYVYRAGGNGRKDQYEISVSGIPSGSVINSAYLRARAKKDMVQQGGYAQIFFRIRKSGSDQEFAAQNLATTITTYSQQLSGYTLSDLQSITEIGWRFLLYLDPDFYGYDIWLEVDYTVPTPGAPILDSPANNYQTFEQFLNFVWEVPTKNDGINYHFTIAFFDPYSALKYIYNTVSDNNMFEWDQGTGNWVPFPANGVPPSTGTTTYKVRLGQNYFYPGTWLWEVCSYYSGIGSSSWVSRNLIEKLPDAPIIEAPTSGQVLTANPIEMRATVPQASDNQMLHFQLDIATDSAFTNIINSYDTANSQTGWEYYNGTSWGAFPPGGVSEGVGKVRFKRDFICDQYWWRIRAKLVMTYTFHSTYVSSNFYKGYTSPKLVQSAIYSLPSSVNTVKLIPTQSCPSGTSISYQISVDGGSHFTAVTPNVKTTLGYTGNSLIWKATLATTDPKVTPKLEAIEIDVYPNPASFAIDGSYSTYWKSEGKSQPIATEDLTIDFNGTYGINTVHIVPNISGLTVTGYYTPDGTNYLQIFQVSNLTEQKISFPEVSAKGIKLTFTNLGYESGKYYAAISEVEAYQTVVQSGRDLEIIENHFFTDEDVETTSYCTWDGITKYTATAGGGYLILKNKVTLSTIHAIRVSTIWSNPNMQFQISLDNGSTWKNLGSAVNSGKFVILNTTSTQIKFQIVFNAVGDTFDYYKAEIVYKEKMV